MSTVKSYPHYEINVKDNSIYNVAVEEILPVHRALWVLPTQKGPVGTPVWIKDKKHFDRIFGKQTLDSTVRAYKSPATTWLKSLIGMNGQFIVRALSDTAKKATAILYAVVKEVPNGMVEYKRNADGSLKTILETVTERVKFDNEITDADIINSEQTSDYGRYAVAIDSASAFSVKESYCDSDDPTKTIKYIKVGSTWYKADGTAAAAPDGTSITLVKKENLTYIVPKTTNCLQITFVVEPATPEQLEAINEETITKENGFDVKTIDGAKWYPILAVAANYEGEYGNNYAFRFFSKNSDNNAENVAWFRSAINSFAAYQRDYNSTTTSVIEDSYGRGTVNFTADPKCLDRETGLAKDMESIIESSYDSDGEETDEFPFLVFSFEENLKAIGEQIILNEYNTIENITPVATFDALITALRNAANNNDYTYDTELMNRLGFNEMNYESFIGMYDEFKDNHGEIGYAVNVLSGINPNGEPYSHVKYSNGVADSIKPFAILTPDPGITGFDIVAKINSNDDDNEYLVSAPEEDIASSDLTQTGEIVKLGKYTDIYLRGGQDAASRDTMWNDEGYIDNSFLDKAMYDFVTLRTNKKIVDKFRYPITHIYDIGYSMTTKFAMLDFLDIRDDVAVELTTQVLLSSRWATGFDRSVTINDQYEDTMNGIVLRERALMMKESVLFGTDCMRASIYTQCGLPVNLSAAGSIGISAGVPNKDPMPFLFWSAYQHAMYENRPYMSVREPRGLPYSYNNLFKSWKWVPYQEQQKERTWNTGLNYCQYADMTRLFYPALRTVYRYDTSILVDQWDVDALIYTKHECRKAWAHFVGRNDKREVLQSGIKKYLEDKLKALYSDKFEFGVEVYQTEEEQKIGYIQHVRLTITFPATLRVIIFDIEVNREGYTPEE